jgi:two-component sensor histidine kinase
VRENLDAITNLIVKFHWMQERTMEFAQANKASRAEIAQRKRTEEEKQELLRHLQERVKELTALHTIARLLQNDGRSASEILQEIVTFLPSAWQYPESTAARIQFDGMEYTTPNFLLSPWNQEADFTTSGGKQGMVVVYLEDKPNAVEGPFLAEERSLLNAVDAIGEGGTVTVATCASAPPETPRLGVVIEITDSGCGIPPELLPRIFDLFVTTKTPGKGTGLGLMVCQEIVKSHGGTIDISSQVGQGTRVRIFLPTDEEGSDVAPVERQV